jgi:Holliday junction resolvasome RuvABC endonuclease subunit
MKIIGLDLSITATGTCSPAGVTNTITGKAALGDDRLITIRNRVRVIAVDWRPDLAVIEDLPTGAHGAAALGMVQGVVRAELKDRGVPYVLVTAATLKAYATGKGNSDKSAMILAAYKRSGREFKDNNQCDAFWLWAAGMDHYGSPQFTLPQAQRDRLGAVKWPVVSPADRGTRGSQTAAESPLIRHRPGAFVLCAMCKDNGKVVCS